MIVSAALCPSPPLLAPGLTGQADILPELRAACAAAVSRMLASGPDLVAVVGPAEPAVPWDPAAGLDLSGYAPALAGAANGPRSARAGDSGRHAAHALPLSLGIAALLLDEAGYRGPSTGRAVSPSESPEECERRGRQLARLPELHGTVAPASRARVPWRPSRPPPSVGLLATSGEAPRVALLVMGDGTARRSASAPGYLDERAEPFDAGVERALRDGDLPALAALDPALAADLMATNRAPLQVLAAALSASLPSGARPRADILYSAAPLGVAYLVATLPGR